MEGNASRNVRVLQDLHLIEAKNPMLTELNARQRRYRLRDHLMRFWFRFVFPYQEKLACELTPQDHYDANIAPRLAEHVSPVFEELCRAWVWRAHRGEMDSVGQWGGPARHELRRHGVRATEEIDVVAADGRRVTPVGECKWTTQKMCRVVLDDLLQYKLPALTQAGVDVSEARIVLFSRSGFAPDLLAAARERGVELVDVERLVDELPAA
jgi:hypothetical protein